MKVIRVTISFYSQFEDEKKGDDEISSPFRGALEQNLRNFVFNLTITSGFFDECLKEFSESMHKSINDNSIYYTPDELRNLFDAFFCFAAFSERHIIHVLNQT